MAANSYKLTLSYDGEKFEGWQIQNQGQRTIQGELNKALQKISKSNEVKSIGSGRTDSGVHAVAQIAKCEIQLAIDPGALKRALNSHLPPEIRIIDVELSDTDFHPVRDAKWKTYDYLVFEGDELPPFLFGKVCHQTLPLDWNLVESALQTFRGEHDFVNFSTKGTEVSSTIRTIYSCEVTKILIPNNIGVPFGGTDLIRISVTGNGFLKQMVRLLVGTAFMAGRSRVSADDIRRHFDLETETKLGPVAPASGLYLKHVEYEHERPS